MSILEIDASSDDEDYIPEEESSESEDGEENGVENNESEKKVIDVDKLWEEFQTPISPTANDGAAPTPVKKIKKTFEFAGESVVVEVVDEPKRKIPSKQIELIRENCNHIEKIKNIPKLKRGLERLVKRLEYKPKLTLLEKSRLDWEKYVVEEKLHSDLDNFIKGKDSYVQRQNFLKNANYNNWKREQDEKRRKK
ncbi:hypothetical protein SNEBB_003838 [Seison nebaliae]|nr:hypothetical protein SNEBB_003838 [Seison nebaliae]